MRRHLRELGGREHRPVDADARVAALGQWRDAAEAGPEPARHAGLERQLRGDVELPDRLEHRGWPAGEELDVAQVLGEQIGDEPVVTGGPVVGRQCDIWV